MTPTHPMTHRTVETTKLIALDVLECYPANPRRGDVKAIRESLERSGQYRALVVRRQTFEVLAGNHTLQAMRELGYEKALCHLVDVDDEQARAIVLADNRTAELAGYDDEALAALLGEMDDLAGTGWHQAALDDLLGQLPEPSAPRASDPPESEQPSRPERECPACGHRWSE